MEAEYFLTNDGKKIASGKMMIHGDFVRDIEMREGVKFKTWVIIKSRRRIISFVVNAAGASI